MSSPAQVPLGRNEFKCFQCRKVFPKREGAWINWNQMQVHLCRKCEKETHQAPERK